MSVPSRSAAGLSVSRRRHDPHVESNDEPGWDDLDLFAGLGRLEGDETDRADAEGPRLDATPELFAHDREIRWSDGLLASVWKMRHDAVVTTPNAKWMPEFPVAKPGRICTRVDGRWGPQEYSLWPQLYHPRVLHHACIPAKGARIDVVDYMFDDLWEPVSENEWAPDSACGVPELGFLSKACLASLRTTARTITFNYRQAGGGRREAQKKFGYHLCTTVEQALDRISILPTWRSHAIALAAHIRRLCLELTGLILLLNVVQRRADDPSFRAKGQALPVRSAFTADPTTAQELFRLGIPVWFIQPLTKTLRIVEVVSYPTSVSTILSDTLSQPRLYSGSGDMAGIVHHPGDWPYKMQEEALKALLELVLPALPRDEPEASGEPQPKKAKIDDSGANRHDNTARPGKKSRPTHRGKRAPPRPPLNPVEAHPSLRYRAPTACAVPAIWADALAAVGTLPAPPSAASYYWPPPFVFENAGGKAQRYLHNYVRIRGFCQQRLLDPSLGASPLRIAEWRDGLWGDYTVHELQGSSTSLTKQSKERQAIQQNVRKLFSRTAGLATYGPDQAPVFNAKKVSLDVANDPILRAQVIWEAHEVNWRCELRDLDAHLTGSRDWPALARWERETSVSRVWTSFVCEVAVCPRA
ncbi:hypothetical protein FOMPIDRAFT_1052168 [Fomitopsis schrenkii]|uniref:Uncharacterized protein n=1 Tax=Fomitopsis schrenkii TaxID=2126942 RepID=S8DZ07_FOMSC|nr:hypothetical protein FOMPIDRAFT_1052168 [Fomitopsis schrenkii]